MERIHVIPINDLVEHSNHEKCRCNPKTLEENGYLIIVHNSFDDRELFEELRNKGIKISR